MFWLFQSLPTEHARQAFVIRDKDRSGSLPALEFVALMKDIRGFKMSLYVQDNLLSVSEGRQREAAQEEGSAVLICYIIIRFYTYRTTLYVVQRHSV